VPALVGRGRAFEILLGGGDYSGAMAEKYGYVNRAIPDIEFPAFVNEYATRVSLWDRRVIADIKRFINKYTMLPDSEYPLHSDAFWGAASRPEFQLFTAELFRQGLQKRSDIEYHLGREVGKIFPKI
jgi:enoyl-CoA hydratase/carnithine racemase